VREKERGRAERWKEMGKKKRVRRRKKASKREKRTRGEDIWEEERETKMGPLIITIIYTFYFFSGYRF